jgi:hypothetical protein
MQKKTFEQSGRLHDVAKYEIRRAWRNRRDCDLLMVCDFKSLRVRRAGNKDRLGPNRLPVSFQACETAKAVDSSSVLQSPARGCFGFDQELDSRRLAVVRCLWRL